MIPTKVLESYKARLISVRKDQLLFQDGDEATHFYQVEEGQVKMFTLNDEGQEFTHGVFQACESFGEPALLGGFPYPSSAIAITEGKVWKISKQEFLQLLKENFDLHLKLDYVLCKRLQYKSMILTEVSTHEPEHRLATIMKYLKRKMTQKGESKTVIPFTRQQLADMTGLRVETVIRTIKKMEQSGKLKLEKHKIIY